MKSEPNWLVRIIECFDKKTELLVSEQILRKVDLELLQKEWGQPKTEPMIDCYDINHNQASYLISIAPELEFDFENYDYQISAITTDLKQSQADGGFMGKYPPPRVLPAFKDAMIVKSK